MNILFDLDGTLTDPRDGIVRSIEYALNKMDAETPSALELTQCIGPPLRDSFASFLQTSEPDTIEQAITYFRERFSVKGLYENTLYPGITTALKQLSSESHTLFIATSKPRDFAKIIIDHFELTGFFKAIYGSEMDGKNSEKTGLISLLIEDEQLSSADTVMIGDRKFDMRGAKSNALLGIGVLWGYGSRDELRDSDADILCHTPLELPKVLAF